MGTDLDRATARALVEAGYMPLDEYVRLFGEEVLAEANQQSPNNKAARGLHDLNQEPAHKTQERKRRSILPRLLGLFHR